MAKKIKTKTLKSDAVEDFIKYFYGPGIQKLTLETLADRKEYAIRRFHGLLSERILDDIDRCFDDKFKAVAERVRSSVTAVLKNQKGFVKELTVKIEYVAPTREDIENA